ncbi:hypothetical protein [Clostridium sp.]|uniref:hypothetical protein n=1 Tax=Clostridium sp. TaxID=1506 RepID=UPI003D6C7E15
MVKNNLKSLLIHIIVSIISMFVFIIFNMAQAKWASEAAARNHHYNMMFVAVITIAVAVISYYLLARKHLINQGTVYNNLFSVSLTLILGVLLWANAFTMDRIGPSNHLLNSQLWQHYTMYNGYSFFILNETGNNNPYVFLIFNFMPFMAMLSGIRSHRS